ncbi:Ig-like domain-containing protein [Oryzomonas japonica]|nr:Ig-like domain-containing protein [Oryzomonas japonica]
MRNLLWSGVLMVLLSGCGWDGTATRNNDITPLTAITITADYSTIALNTSVKLKATGNYSGLFTRDISDKVTWTSDTPTVAAFATTANPNRVTGKGAGSAVLTATLGSVSATYAMKVSTATPTAVTVTPAAPTLAKGLTTQFAATGTFSDGSTQVLTFDAAWASSDATVASVSDAADDTKGLATALAAGTTTISATFGGISGTAILTATAPTLQSIAVSPAKPSVLSLTKTAFTATGTYSDGTTGDITSQVTWASSNTNAAPAPAAGTTVTSAPGTTTISATLGSVGGSTTLKVTGGTLTSFSISPNSRTLVKGTMGRISATGVFSDGTSRDITGALAWTVDFPNRATLTEPSGNVMWVSALASGAVTITADSASLRKTATVTVTAPSLNHLEISPTSLSLTKGSTGRFALTAIFNDGTSQVVTDSSSAGSPTTWSSNTTSVATVGTTGLASGQVTAVAAGTTATITAAYGGTTITATVTVTAKTPKRLDISPSGTTNAVAVGSATPFTATVTYSDNTTADVTKDTVWTISDANVAVLADSQQLPGQVMGVDSGTATLTATFGGITAPTVTVKVP